MVNPRNFVNLPAGVGCLWLAAAIAANAQVVPDSTVNTIVTPNGNSFEIEGGSTAGSNLFHSFSEFSLPTGSEAFFNNAGAIDNIITRVTGGSISNIDGLIRANGTANLFLLNPNGIVFGPNASLDLGGSFLASSADAIQFADAIEFSASDTNSSPLLSVNVPVGLQFGRDPGSIVNHSTVNRGSSVDIEESIGLSVQPGRTLALVGGEVRLEAEGSLTAPGGRIELGGVGSRQDVGIDFAGGDFALDYNGVRRFADVVVSGEAIVNSSGDPNGPIQIQANTFRVDNSQIVAANLGSQPGEALTLNAAEGIEFVGSGLENFADENFDLILDNDYRDIASLPNGIYAIAFGTGNGGEINVTSPNLSLRDSSFLLSRSANPSATAGNMDFDIARSIIVDASSIGSNSDGETGGSSADMTVNTRQMRLLNGGRMVTESFGEAGFGGDFTVNASHSIEIIGFQTDVAPDNREAGGSFIGTGTAGRQGGDMRVSTRRLTIREGGFILATSVRGERPGDLFVEANVIDLSGVTPDEFTVPSSIFTGSFAAQPDSVAGGNLTVVANRINLSDGAAILSTNFAPGVGGDLNISANTIRLEDNAYIETTNAFGEGGNINITARSLQLRDGSRIDTQVGRALNPVFANIVAVGTGGDGGNISIDTNALIARNNSDIFTDVLSGSGGQIDIDANAIVGAQFREELTPFSDIATISTFDEGDSAMLSCRDDRAVQVASKDNAGEPNSNLSEATDWFIDEGGEVTLVATQETPTAEPCR